GKGVIGTGPFKFVSWVPEDQVVLARNDAYWGGKPAWDKVSLRVFKNDSARTAAMLSGDVDMIEDIPTTDTQRLRKDAQVSVVNMTSNRLMYLHMDQGRSTSPFAKGPDGSNPLLKRDVREALSLSIDRAALVQRIMDGQGTPAGQVVPDGYFGQDPTLKVPAYDAGKAKALLARAGYPHGFELTLHASNDRYPNDSKIAQALGQLFSRIGIKTGVVTLPASVYFSRASKLEFSMIMGGAAVETGEPSGVLGPLLETYGPGAGQGNRGRYSSPAFDAALKEARHTLDEGAREALLRKATEIAMHDVGIIPLFFLDNTWAMKKGLSYPGRSDGYTLAFDVKAK
ncbi:MAG: ABC transporter substrate-binding protein, partial [Rhodospirillales bacterium]|nr:ABC transporter substrate-binding protein [Rhodospirillales bacterium]